MSPRLRFATLASLCLTTLALAGCKAETAAQRQTAERAAAREREQAQQARQTCASGATNERLKQVLFEKAIGIGNADPVNLDTLAANSQVRIEEPVVRSRDAALDLTICRGKLVLMLPLGAERGFAGERNLRADVEYAAQAAADGSGMVFRIDGADPIIARLAAFDMRGKRIAPPVVAEASASPAPPPVIEAPIPGRREVAPSPRPIKPPPQPRVASVDSPRPRHVASPAPVRAGRQLPSYDCRRASTRSERMVCSDGGLAALDRAMSSQFYAALTNSDAGARAELRRSRDRFLRYRERCPDAACVAAAYRDRMDEIRDIAGD